MEEPYQKILNCLLLREIFGHLRLADQLNMRKVNKDWEDEAKFALRENPEFKINLVNNLSERSYLSEFLLDNYAPPCKPNGLLPIAKIVLQPSKAIDRRLDLLGQQHAEYIRNLTLSLGYNNMREIASFETKSKYLLKYCPNLEKLQIEAYGTRKDFVPSSLEFTPLGSILPKLRFLDIACPASNLELPYSIILNAPALRFVTLDLREALDLHPLTNKFLDKIQNLRLKILNLTLSLSNSEDSLRGQSSLLGELIQSGLKSEQLIIYLEPIQNGDTPTQAEKNRLNALITKFCNTGLQKFCLRSHFQDDLHISLPRAPHLRSLDFLVGREKGWSRKLGPQRWAHSQYFATICIDNSRTEHQNPAKLVQNVSPLTSGQVPNLESLVTEWKGSSPLDEDNIFVNMKKLVLESGLGFPSSLNWPKQLPNLTILDTHFEAGHEDFLDPIFTEMINLVKLSLRYYGAWQVTSESIWNKITGGLEPMLSKNSPLDAIILPDSVSQDAGSAQPLTGLQNLRKLQVLILEGIPSCIFVGIVNLSATQKIPRLSKLKMFHVLDFYGEHETYSKFDPAQEWIDVLERYHGYVEAY